MWVLFLFLLVSCENTFDYSIYSAKVEEKDKDTRKSNFEKLKAVEAGMSDTSTFIIALLSDSHTYYDDLNDVVDAINANTGIDFVIHGGDMTDGGLLTEYFIFRSIMEQLNKPYFTVIGNHDCLANGRRIYLDMYGYDNYSFDFLNCSFVFFNDVFWEMNYTEPEFEWFADELNKPNPYRQKFVIAHIPPWDEQFTPVYNTVYRRIVDSAHVSLSIHGHLHNHDNKPSFYEIPYLVIGSPHKRAYVEMKVSTDTVILQNREF